MPSPGRTPTPAQSSPEKLASVILAADSTGDWATILRLVHPDASEEFRRDQVKMFDTQQYEGLDSCMIRRFRDLDKQWQNHLRFTLDSIFLVPTLDSLKRLPADTVFTRYGQYLDRSPRPLRPPDQPELKILGAVSGPHGTQYVVVHEDYATRPFPEWPSERTEIMTFRQVNGAWRSMLDGPIHFQRGWGLVLIQRGDSAGADQR